MASINFRPAILPKKEVIAVCSECGEELARKAWSHYGEYNRQVKSIEKEIKACKHCKAVFQHSEKKAVIPWQKTTDGDYIAKAKDGDFLVWKYGFGYRWRYRKYGAKEPERINYARTRAEAQKACQRHEAWK